MIKKNCVKSAKERKIGLHSNIPFMFLSGSVLMHQFVGIAELICN